MENVIQTTPTPLKAKDSTDPHPAPVPRENLFLLAGALGLGFLFNLLFYQQSVGISYPLFIVGFYAVFLTYAKPVLAFKWDIKGLLGVSILALSLGYCFYSNAILGGLNLLIIPVLVVTQTLLSTGSNHHAWFSAGFGGEVLQGILWRPLQNLAKPFHLLGASIQTKTESEHYTVCKKVLLGLIIAAPLLCVVVILLASADQIFGRMVGNLAATIFAIDLGDSIVQLGIIGTVCLLTFSYLYGLKQPRTGSSSAATAAAEFVSWDPVIVITVLSSLNLIYLLFCLVQFSYLFGSLNSSLPYAFSYAEYARRGFFELNFITLINLTMLLLNLRFTPQASGKTGLTVKMLNTLLVICTLVLDLSAHFRMSFYEAAYGYTYLRLLTHAFMGVILAWLIASLWRIWKVRVQLLKAFIVIGLSALILVNYVNIDAVIARQNIARYHKTGKIDVAYLNSLSCEAVPELVKLLKSQDQDVVQEIREGLVEKEVQLKDENSWQAFNLSKARTRRILSALKW